MSLNKSTLKITSILGAKKEKPASDSKVNRLNTIHYGIEKVAERILGSKMNFNYRTTYHYPNVLTIDFNLTEKISVYIYVDDASSLIKISLDERIQPAVHGYNPEDHSIKKHPRSKDATALVSETEQYLNEVIADLDEWIDSPIGK